MDALDEDAVGQAELVRSGEVSPSELVEASIARIEELDDRLNAVVIRWFDRALDEARGPLPDGPLRGVPVVLKDWGAPLAGLPLTNGCRVLKDAGYVAPATGYITQHLIDAGAVILGRTNQPELALMPCTDNRAYGATRNPWNLEHSVGGSSGGSAAAVAARCVAVAHASDGGGSIRIPASCCGLVGLKPSRGRLSRGPLQGEGWGGIAVDGVVTRTVRDTALLLDVMGGPGVGDPYTAATLPRPLTEELGADPGTLRVGIWLETPDVPHGPHPACVEAVHLVAAALEEAGHRVEDARPAALDDWSRHFAMPLTAAGVAMWTKRTAAELGKDSIVDELEPIGASVAKAGFAMDAVSYVEAVDRMHALTRRIVAWWVEDGFDLLLSPVLGMPPAPLGWVRGEVEKAIATGTSGMAQYLPYPGAANVTGLPAIALPVHMSDGLPIGVQLVAGPWREDILIRVASFLEGVVGWRDRPLPTAIRSA